MNKDYRYYQLGFNYRYDTWHTVGRNMILYVHSGSGNVVSREQNYPITRGCLCFVGANKFYYTLPDIPEEYIRSKIFLSNQALDRILSLFPEESKMKKRFAPNTLVYAQIDLENMGRVEKIFEELSRYADHEYYHDALITSLYTRLLIDLNENATDSVPPSSGTIPKAVEYINSHIYQNIEIDDICDAIHVSKYYFCRKFKQVTGTTVMNYILSTRITSAKSMLENPALSISEVSEQCGFSSISYFCRVFKEESGMTPLQFQKKLQAKKVAISSS